MFTKDLERLIRSLVRQRTDPEYIRYYLMDTYQLSPKIVDELFKALNVGQLKQKFNTKQGPLSGDNKSPAQRRPFT